MELTAPRHAPRLAPLLAALALAGCSLVTDSFVTNEFSGDPYPIQAELASGAIVLGIRQDGAPDRVAVLDVLSPVTLDDPGPGVAPSVASAEWLVLGEDVAGGALIRPRALLPDLSVLSLHPCDDAQPTCQVGTAAAPRAFDAIIGADALAGDAVRLRLGDDQVFVLADIGGAEIDRTRACDAVFPAPFRGGGTLIIAGTERTFGGRRIALGACLGANPDPALPQGARGADALLVMSTGIGVSILGEAAYLRYLEAHAAALAPLALPPELLLANLPIETVYLPSGPVEGRRGSLPTLALIAQATQTPRAACRQVYANHFMLQRDCATGDDCPCEDGSRFCATPAIVELAPPAGIGVLIVPDANPTLQALRAELRPDQAEVDGILGTDALRTSEIDIDYPHNRLLGRCTAEGCVARPALPERGDRTQVRGCLANAPASPPL